MPTFPRTLLPKYTTIPEIPGPLISLGQTGGVQLRAGTAIGRTWTEEWGPLALGSANVGALLAFIETCYRNGTTFSIVHYALPGSGVAPVGLGGGSPLVQGASQTGASLVTDTWSNSITGVVAAGDVIRVAGLDQLFTNTATVNSTSSGVATLTIDPPIAAGGSPADDAALTRASCTINAYISEKPSFPRGEPGSILAGLKLTFREAP